MLRSPAIMQIPSIPERSYLPAICITITAIPIIIIIHIIIMVCWFHDPTFFLLKKTTSLFNIQEHNNYLLLWLATCFQIQLKCHFIPNRSQWMLHKQVPSFTKKGSYGVAFQHKALWTNDRVSWTDGIQFCTSIVIDSPIMYDTCSEMTVTMLTVLYWWCIF